MSGTLPDEDGAIARVIERVRDTGPLRVGPGHDCAVLDVPGGQVVVTTDVLVDGVHFELASCGAAAAGAKALLVNLSDLAAAAAVPIGCEVGVVLPRMAGAALLDELAAGLAEVAARYGCPLAGGDTNVADGPLVLAVTALGRPGVGGIVTRAGARIGDRLSVTGRLGGSRLGRHLDFVPRLDAGQALARLGVAHAMMDLSDGLSCDLPRLCRASGVGARVVAEQVPVHDDARRLADGRPPLEHALHDGEDFELLVAHAPLDEDVRRALEAAGVGLVEIGEVLDSREGIHIVEEGAPAPLVPRGWDHFEQARRWRVTTEDEEGTRRLGRALGRAAEGAVASGLVVALHGNLGAGKTVLVQGIGSGLGVPTRTPIVSPTFTIARSYPASPASAFVLHHLDAYRLEGVDDLENAGFEDMCGAACLTCVEWAERVEDALPEDRLDVTIQALEPREEVQEGAAPVAPRIFEVQARGERATRVLNAWRSAYAS